MIITNYTLFRAVSLVRANEKYPSKILTGILINPATGCATATDGHRILRAQVAEPGGIGDPFVWKPLTKLHKSKREHAILFPDHSLSTYETAIHGKKLDGDYPDTDKFVEPFTKTAPEGLQTLGIDITLLLDVMREMGAYSVKLSWEGPSHQIDVKFLGKAAPTASEYIFRVMPLRID